MASGVFPLDYFVRHDERDDSLFYEVPRKAVYLDGQALSILRRFYLKVLPLQGTVLDLMSSWRSHIPVELRLVRVAGLGLNRQEMADNDQLDDVLIHDLNEEPTLPFGNEHFDAVLCTVSIQYVIKPIEVYREVNRILKPGGLFVVAFSDRCFPEKTIAIWRVTTPTQRTGLVAAYFEESGNWRKIEAVEYVPDAESHASTDPLYIVWAEKSINCLR